MEFRIQLSKLFLFREDLTDQPPLFKEFFDDSTLGFNFGKFLVDVCYQRGMYCCINKSLLKEKVDDGTNLFKSFFLFEELLLLGNKICNNFFLSGFET